MIYADHWIKWPFAKFLLRRSFITLTHNEDVRAIANDIHIPTVVLRDPLPNMSVPTDIEEVAEISIRDTAYVIVPWGMAPDEPVKELFKAAGATPEVLYVMTWFKERLPVSLQMDAPDNIVFTGFLPEMSFNALYANARAALVLTTLEGTQPSGAAEAIALGIPLVVSDIRTTRRLYQKAAVFVTNEPDSIASGILYALENNIELSSKVAGLRKQLVEDASSQVNEVKRLLLK